MGKAVCVETLGQRQRLVELVPFSIDEPTETKLTLVDEKMMKKTKTNLANGEITAPLSVEALFTSAARTDIEPRPHRVLRVGNDQSHYFSCSNDVALPICEAGIEGEPSGYIGSVQEQRDAVAKSLRDLADKVQSGDADASFTPRFYKSAREKQKSGPPPIYGRACNH